MIRSDLTHLTAIANQAANQANQLAAEANM